MSVFYPAADNDLALTVNARGKKALALETNPAVCSGIKLFHRFQFFEGEWFLDVREGTPYFRLILVKNPDLAVIRRVIRRVILSVPGISDVGRIDLEYNAALRTLAFTFDAVGTGGATISGGSGVPFIVDGKEVTT